MRAVWYTLIGTGAAKGLAGLVAALAVPGALDGANAGGVARSHQAMALAICAAAALLVAGRHPVRLAWCACWALGSACFGRVFLALGGWPNPPVEAALWLAVPVAVALPAITASRPVLAGRHRALTFGACASLVVVGALSAAAVRNPGAAVQAIYWSALLFACTGSALALRRHDVRTRI